MSAVLLIPLVLRRFVPGVVGLVLVVVAAALPLPSYAAGPTAKAAETIETLPFTSKVTSKPGEQRAADTDADNARLSAACNGGGAMYRVRWSTYTATSATTVVARGEMYSITGRDRYALSSGVAILTSTKAVIDCNVVDGHGIVPGPNQTVAVAGPTKVAAGTTVYIVQFVREDPGAGCNEFVCYELEQNLSVLPVAGAYPLADNWFNATPITSSPSKHTVDTTLSTQDEIDSDLFRGDCGSMADSVTRTVWWTLTPTADGPVDASVDWPYVLGYAELTSDGVQPLDTSCGGSPALKKGHTYLIMAGILEYYRSDEAGTGGPITLAVNSAPSLGKPDLVVTKMSASPTAPKAGDPVTFRATITNKGTASTGNGVVHGVGFRVDGVIKTWADTNRASLAPGKSVTVTVNGGVAGPAWAATAGNHTVLATVDDVNRVPGEISESNNTRSLSVPVVAAAGRPDLVVTGVSWSPVSPAAGSAVTFKATVKNRGTAPTPAGVILGAAFKVDGVVKTYSDTWKVSLAAGASTTLTASGGTAGKPTWPATVGQHALTATVDDINRIETESDESNNRLTVPLNIGAVVSRPDLVVTGVSWTPSSPAAGSLVKLTAALQNVGTRSTPAGRIVGVSFRPNGQATGTVYADTYTTSVPPGATVTVTTNGGGSSGAWKVPAGSTPVVVIVDDINRFAEASEANNELRTTVTTG